MSLQQLRNCNFGTARANVTGSTGVGYALFDQAGSLVTARTTTGVYQLMSGTGIYAAYVSFPDSFHGQVLWDCPSFTGSTGDVLGPAYAVEQYNVEENNPKVDLTYATISLMSGTLSQLYGISFGRWQIVSNQMIFYADDNSTELVRFNLFDDVGNPTMDQVFERQKV